MGLFDRLRRKATEPTHETTTSTPAAAPAIDQRSTRMTAITIVGAGNMARGIATRALAGGHAVQILARDTSQATTLAGELGGDVTTGGLDDALSGDIVVLALPYDAALAVAEQRRDDLAGKVVVDISNPVDFATFDRLVTPADSSAAEEIAKVAAGAKVVKAFNTTFASTLVAGEVAGEKLDVLVASDDVDAKAAVVALVESSGMRALDAGPLKRSHQLEGMGFVHMALQAQLGNTWSTGVKVVGA
ncbi:reduced coenzyme F420:NADP oxidoreductase [Georgenia soli]|uniref:Reduced coenzyme F420:NADP oxidoreductase n=1 Tax=Georgenia soli TaxID=638953 RepID=A0A2A9EP80_9MICO|nr:NADPH-dependent F420 reductase [Georgenia soli]PFG40897.1 reduced coenzyme F420:NADP oxidoreductase [Georgenia soli]